MKRIDTHQFYRLGSAVHPITTLPDDAQIEVRVIFFALFRAKSTISFVRAGLPPSSKSAANALLAQIAVCGGGLNEIDLDSQVTSPEMVDLVQRAKDFEIALASDLPWMDTYQVFRKGAYAIPELMESAEVAITEGLSDAALPMIPQTSLVDFNQAGKCLALELPTASGFHTMRSVEAVVGRYWEVVSHSAVGVRPPDMDQCIRELRAAGENEKLIAVLDHIRELNRNTVLDRAAFLQLHEALLLFDVSKNAISGIAERLGELDSAASKALRVLRPKPPRSTERGISGAPKAKTG